MTNKNPNVSTLGAVKKDRASNRNQNEASVLPFPPLPVQLPPFPQSRSTNRTPLIIGIFASIGLIALLIYVVPWRSVSQTLTGSFNSLSTQVKQIQFAQVKQPKQAAVPPETSTSARHRQLKPRRSHRRFHHQRHQ